MCMGSPLDRTEKRREGRRNRLALFAVAFAMFLLAGAVVYHAVETD